MALPASFGMLLRAAASTPGIRSGTAFVIFVALAPGLGMLLMRTAMAAFTALATDIRHVLTIPADRFTALAAGRARFLGVELMRGAALMGSLAALARYFPLLILIH